MEREQIKKAMLVIKTALEEVSRWATNNKQQ
jgi:hypothetical protein